MSAKDITFFDRMEAFTANATTFKMKFNKSNNKFLLF